MPLRVGLVFAGLGICNNCLAHLADKEGKGTEKVEPSRQRDCCLGLTMKV